MDSEKFLATLDTHELSALAAALPAEVIEHEARRRGMSIGVHAVAAEVIIDEPDVDPVPITKETLQLQLPAASEGYSHTVNSLNTRADEAISYASPETIADEFNAWFTDEKILAAEALRQYNPAVQFTLVATPNVVANHVQIVTAGRKSAERINRRLHSDGSYSRSFSPAELSGTNPYNTNQIQFSLIPNTAKAGPEGTVNQQKRALVELKAEHPAIKVPSLLEAVTFWSTLEAGGDMAEIERGRDRTYIRHFDLVFRGEVGLNAVPNSSFTGGAGVFLSDSTARYVLPSRLSVG